MTPMKTYFISSLQTQHGSKLEDYTLTSGSRTARTNFRSTGLEACKRKTSSNLLSTDTFPTKATSSQNEKFSDSTNTNDGPLNEFGKISKLSRTHPSPAGADLGQVIDEVKLSKEHWTNVANRLQASQSVAHRTFQRLVTENHGEKKRVWAHSPSHEYRQSTDKLHQISVPLYPCGGRKCSALSQRPIESNENESVIPRHISPEGNSVEIKNKSFAACTSVMDSNPQSAPKYPLRSPATQEQNGSDGQSNDLISNTQEIVPSHNFLDDAEQLLASAIRRIQASRRTSKLPARRPLSMKGGEFERLLRSPPRSRHDGYEQSPCLAIFPRDVLNRGCSSIHTPRSSSLLLRRRSLNPRIPDTQHTLQVDGYSNS